MPFIEPSPMQAGNVLVPCFGVRFSTSIKDAELIAQVIRRNPSAQSEFVRRFERLIYSILRRTPLPFDVSLDDAFQQVIVKLWENDFHRLKLWRNTGRFSGYLGVIVLRVAQNFRRQNEIKTSEIGEMEAITPNPEHRILQQEKRNFVRSALKHLNERDREVLILRYIDELSYKEIAKLTGLTINHVGVVLARAQKRLEKHLCQVGYISD